MIIKTLAFLLLMAVSSVLRAESAVDGTWNFTMEEATPPEVMRLGTLLGQ